MTDAPGDERRWPSSPAHLADTHLCPGCFETVTGAVCASCGLDLGDPRMSQVLEIGRAMATAERERQAIIARVRMASAVAAAAAAVIPPPLPPTPEPAPEPVGARPAPTAPAVPAPAAPPASAPAPAGIGTPLPPAPPRTPRRRLTVPVLLLIVGVSLVGVAAVFFILLAWFVAGVELRAVIVATITLATIVAASLLRRRRLVATAEGIGALGVVLLGLDAWAVRANDLFGTDAVAATVWAGASLLVVAALCRLWSRVSRLRAPDLAAALALPAGLGLLAGGLIDAAPGEAIAAGLLGAALGGLAHALPAPWSAARGASDAVAERTVLAVSGVTALVLAAAVGAFATSTTAAALWIGAATIVLGVAHARILHPEAPDAVGGVRLLRGVASSLAALVAAAIGWQLVARDAGPVVVDFVAPVAAVAVAVLMDVLRMRVRWLRPAALTAAAVAAPSIAAVLLLDGVRGALTITTSWQAWRTDPTASTLADPAPAIWSLGAGVVIAVLLLFAPGLRRRGLATLRPILGGAVVLATAVGTATPLVAVGAAAVIVVAAVIALRRTTERGGWVTTGLGAAGAALVLGAATPWLWFIAVSLAVLAPLGQRAALRATGMLDTALVLVPVGVLSVAAFVAPAPLGVLAGAPADPLAGFVLLSWVALLSLGGALLGRVDRSSSRALAGAALGLAAIALIAALALPLPDLARALLGEPWAGVVRAAALLAGVVALTTRRRLGESIVLGAAALIAPLVVGLADAVLTAADADRITASLVLTGVAVAVVWAVALAAARTTDTAARRLRLAVDLGALAVVLLVLVLVALPVVPELNGGLFALLAVGVAGASVTRGWAAPDPRGAHGTPLAQAPRRLLAWPAFALLTFALWRGVASAWPDAALEAYTVAPAAGLVAFAALLVRLRRIPEAATASALGLAMGLVAPAAVGWFDDSPRGFIVGLVAAAVALVVTASPVRRVVPVALAAAATATAALLVAATGRIAAGETVDGLWALGVVLIALASSAAVIRGRTDAAPLRVYAAVTPSVVLAVIGAVVTLAAGFRSDIVLAVGVVAVPLLLHIIAAAVHRLPFAGALRWTAIVVAGGAGGALASWHLIEPVEWVSLPAALALLAGAALAARRADVDATVERSAWIAGLVVAVLPSLIVSPDPLRVWLVIGVSLAASLALVFAPLTDRARLRVPSALVLTGAALGMALRSAEADAALAEFAAIVAGAGAVAVAAGLVRVRAHAAVSTSVATAGAVAVVLTVALRLDGELLPAALGLVLGGLAGFGGALLVRRRRWIGFGAVVALGGVLTAQTAAWSRIRAVAGLPGGAQGAEPDAWALGALLIVIVVAGLAARRSALRAVRLSAVIAVAVAVAAFTGAELLLLDVPEPQWRVLLVMTVASLAVAAGWFLRAADGILLMVIAGMAAIVAAGTAIFVGVTEAEFLTVPPALVGTAVGAWWLRSDPAVRSWRALGPWLALLTLPSLAYDFGGPAALWRIVGLGVVAITLVLVGALRQLQAPLVLGSLVLLVHAVAQLWPWIAAAYVAVWWLWLGLGGILLIFVAARYEKRMREVTTAFAAVRALR